ncbi:MAG: BolA family transcriptional regulator [Burkholderiales bacterium]|nr:BolA family transcriptional regulator [Burkholderiales bacterium]
MSSNREDRIRALLTDAFAPTELRVDDESALHAGHAGAASGGGHYRLRLVSSRFEGKNRIERHRLVYASLGELMRTDIHALTITALTPSELGL